MSGFIFQREHVIKHFSYIYLLEINFYSSNIVHNRYLIIFYFIVSMKFFISSQAIKSPIDGK